MGETIDAADGVSSGNDTIYGFGGNDTIFGLAGNDIIKGGGGADTIDGGTGSDIVSYADSTEGVYVDLTSSEGFYGTAAGDTYVSVEHVYGSSYGDALTGHDGDNIVSGLGGNDILKGGGGEDSLYGGDGNDWLRGGADGDLLDGGLGTDTIDYGTSSGAIFINLGNGTAVGHDAQGDELVSIENVTGSAFDDILWGDGGVNVLQGGDGHDELLGNNGNDVLWGGAGNDELNGGTGDDDMHGGAGNDTYWVTNVNDEVFENAGEGVDEVRTTLSHTMTDNIETLILEGGADRNAVGNASMNYIVGNFGNNLIDGGAGADVLSGGNGRDVFIFVAGQANGDIIVDFDGLGGLAGDAMVFAGYGPGATFDYVDNTHWHVTYNGGASVDVITFYNGGANNVHPADYVFV